MLLTNASIHPVSQSWSHLLGDKLIYVVECTPIKCGDVRDGTTGATISIQRYEAYSAFVNFNNFLNAIYEALFDAGTIGIADTGEIVTVSK